MMNDGVEIVFNYSFLFLTMIECNEFFLECTVFASLNTEIEYTNTN